jgi:type VI secretion system protein ImpC
MAMHRGRQHDEDTRDATHLLWGSASFAFAACVANSFARYGWCGAIRGVEGGGLVEGLPTWVHEAENGGQVRSSVEITITDRHEKVLADLGFMPIVQCKGTDYAAFFSVQSCCQPKLFTSEAANANSRLACQLPYVLTASRFMYYFKVVARDSIGSYHTRGDWERLFNAWISQYVLLDDQASSAIKAKYPLREARVEVAEDTSRPGRYRIAAYLRPHFQLAELTVSLRVIGYIN